MELTDKRLVRIQAASGAVFALFLIVHLVNLALATFGPRTYDAAQQTLRRGYQWAPIELAVVIAPLLIHAAAAVTRIVRRRRRGQQAPSNLVSRLHRASGIYLLVFFVGHVTATRGASLLYGVYPRFAGIAFTLRWVPAYFWPYYLGLALAGLFHLVHGLGVALPILGFRAGSTLRRPMLLGAVTLLGGTALVLGMLAFGGVFFDVGQPAASPYARLLVRLGVARP